MEKPTLQMILDKQKEFQHKFGFNEDIKGADLSALIHTHATFAIEEIFEMLRELPYHKYWVDYDSTWSEEKFDDQLEKARKEYIDVLIFVLNVGVFLGFDEQKLRQYYTQKLGINVQRQEDPKLGYIAE